MTVSTASRLGSYEILSPLGAGGMGEVYRARDTRLGRDVAIKVLSGELASNPARLRRFEKEARSASALNHPNIVTIYDFGSTDSTSWIAMELVEGRTLRELLLPGPLPIRKVLALSAQLAEGLSRAHEAGIVHRDLKPENVMVTRDGLVKILDFGLAKLAHSSPGDGDGSRLPTETGTSPGVVLGTVCYMSPEQACGHPLDFRSDQFALGAILYEMITGKRAFEKANAPDTLSAILHEEPAPLAQTAPQTPGPLGWVVERCLAKDAAERYAATRDLARDLANLRDRVSTASGSVLPVEAGRRPPKWRTIGLSAALLLALAGMLWLGLKLGRAGLSQPSFRQLTFRGAGIGSARFAPDGQTIVFSSQTEGKPPELLSMRVDSPETRSLGLPPAHVLSIAPSGEMAILLLKPFGLSPRIGHVWEQVMDRGPSFFAGTLAKASLAGGAPRELLEDVLDADWTADGANLAVIHRTGSRNRVESPIGRVIYDGEEEFLNYTRFSKRDRLAFKDWDHIFIADGSAIRRASPIGEGEYIEMMWSGQTRQIWATRLDPGRTDIIEIEPGRRNRLIASLPADFVLYDVAPDGRVLLGRYVKTTQILGTFPAEPRERTISYFDQSQAIGLSASGDFLLFTDAAQEGGGDIYLRETDGSAPKRLGEIPNSWGLALSPDGRLVLGIPAYGGLLECCLLVPTGPGPTRRLESDGVEWLWSEERRNGFFPDGKSVYYVGREKGRRARVWVQSVDGGRPRAVTPEGVRRPVLLGDGRFFCARSPDSEWVLYPADGNGQPLKATGILPGEEPIQSAPDGLLYVRGADELKPGEALMTTRIYRVDPRTGRRELWKEIPPADPKTGGAVSTIFFSADGKTCVWTHIRYSTELVLAEGLK